MATTQPARIARSAAKLSKAAERDLVRLRRIEDDLYEKALGIAGNGLLGAEVDDSTEEPPAEWVRDRGAAAARQALRIARDIRRPAHQRPGYFDLAAKMIRGISSARSTQTFNAPLCVQVYFGDQQKNYEVLDVTPAESKQLK